MIGFFWEKYILFELKKYRGVLFHNIEEWCKIWRKTDLWFEKWHEKFGKFSPEHLKVWKLGLWWHTFVWSRKGISLKITEELCAMTMKNDTNIEDELTCRFEIDMRPSRILTRALESLKNLCFNWLLVTKVYNAWATKVQRIYLSWNVRTMQILKKNWLVAWKLTCEIEQVFNIALEGVKIVTFMGSFCPKWKRYEQRSYVSWQWWIMQNLKRN